MIFTLFGIRPNFLIASVSLQYFIALDVVANGPILDLSAPVAIFPSMLNVVPAMIGINLDRLFLIDTGRPDCGHCHNKDERNDFHVFMIARPTEMASFHGGELAPFRYRIIVRANDV